MTLRDGLRRLRSSPIGRLLNVPRRVVRALPVATAPLRRLAVWSFASREDTNHSYPLSRPNLRHLAHAIAAVTDSSPETALAFIEEAQADAELANHVIQSNRMGPDRTYSDCRADFAKRLGWYAVARILRPQVVVETGVDKGFGAVVLAAALLRNGSGRYYGTDIDPTAGRLLHGRYAEVGEILLGDSIESLRALGQRIDLFINDSDHSAHYERREYETIAPMLSKRAIVLGDNAHATDELMDWSAATGRRFLFWAEKPVGHWYPGGGIGFSFPAA